MNKIQRPELISLSLVLFLLSPICTFAKDITVRKTILAYTATIDAVSQKYLAKGSGQRTVVAFTILPQKYTPSKVTLYAGSYSWELSGVTQGGSYTAELVEGVDLLEIKEYSLELRVDNALSNIAEATVFDYEGKFLPRDNFQGRIQTEYGLKELVDLAYEITPSNVTLDQIGFLRWKKVTTGVGALFSYGDTGTGEYNAGDAAGNTQLCLVIQSGPSSGMFKCYDKAIIAPTAAHMTRATTNVKHNQGCASAGIALYYWLEPKNVSFSNLEFGEGSSPVTDATGIYVTDPPTAHAENYFGAIMAGDISNGSRVVAMDNAWTERCSWASGGTFTWTIPAQYFDDTGARQAFGTSQIHKPTIQGNGYTTMTKGGQAGSAAVNDPTSGY